MTFDIILYGILISSIVMVVFMIRDSVQQKRQERAAFNMRFESHKKHNVPASALGFDHRLPLSESLTSTPLFRKFDRFGCWYKDGVVHFLCPASDKHYQIQAKDLIYYKVEGSKQYVSRVSGGGGGGSSLGGAVVGGLIGGSTGAIIGSRKGNDPIQTTIQCIDNRKTTLCLRYNGKTVNAIFSNGLFYDTLLVALPEKEFTAVAPLLKQKEAEEQAKQQAEQAKREQEQAAEQSAAVQNTVPSEKPTAEADAVEVRLNRLCDLLQKGVITQEEYDKKRAEILNSI